MLSPQENELLTRTGPGMPMGEVLRRYWIAALLSWEIPEPDCPPVRVKLLGESLVMFRDSEGRIGLLDEYCRQGRLAGARRHVADGRLGPRVGFPSEHQAH